MINYHTLTTPTPPLSSLFRLIDFYEGISLFSSSLEPPQKNKELTGFNPIIVLKENSLTFGKGESIAVKDPLAELDRLTKSIKHLPPEIGWLGYLSYDFKNRLEEKGLYRSQRQGIYEDFYFALYEYYYLSNREEKESRLYRLSFDFPYKQVSSLSLKRFEKQKSSSRLEGTSHDRNAFIANVEKTKEHIRKGNIYQANITRSIHGSTNCDSVSLALDLAGSNRIEYGVFARIPGGHVISTSPELFFKTEGDRILTSPIKGTAPRHRDKAKDSAQKEELLHSEKNLAELAMITDLMRNDLSRVCRPGSVKVSPFPQLMELRNVYHLYADIRGKLHQDIKISSLLKALFPGGSITGCPKIRACQIIEELEGDPRGIYTGSFGVIKANGDTLFNIMIRSFFLQGTHFSYNVGGGITLLSKGEEEFDETVHKGENIYRALNWEDGDE
ncbi:MAG: anthranilate synthase component I family protein [Spirochaetales bacterium]|nr:anthranilate synthase component I family protein [Spirochaetales bacterium]